MKGFQKLTFTYEALQTWLIRLPNLKCRETIIPLTEAFSRVAVEDLTAPEDLPRFDKSAVDGYAVNAEDTQGATQFKPLLSIGLCHTKSESIHERNTDKASPKAEP